MIRHVVLCAATILANATTAAAQAAAPPPPPPIWAVAASVGFALTSGNSDTSSVNFGYDMTYDPKTRNVVKSDGLFLRGKTEGVLASDRLGLNLRDEYRLTGRLYVFGQHQYLHDSFKDIDYLFAPVGGLGYKVVESEETRLSVDGGVGGVWEKNPGVDIRGSGALTLGEKLVRTLTATTTLTQSYAGLWKTADLEDSLHTFGVGVAAAMSTRTQLKVELLDTYKNRPPVPTVEKNDVALLVAVVFKN
jgi:putative salt-induced outer membrane protein